MSSLLDKVNEQKKRTEEQLARGGSRTSARFWKPENGDNKVRIMPQWRNDLGGQFWREVAQHWNVTEDQKGPVLCPKETEGMDGECPICELVQALRADKTNVEAQRLAKELKAKKTYLLNVVVKKDPIYTAKDVAEYTQSRPDAECPFSVGDPKIQVYACPLTIFDQILGIINNSGSDITDLTVGRGISIKKIPNKDRLKTRYEVYPDLEKSDAGLNNPTLPALDQVGFQLDYNGMVDLLSRGKAAEVGSHMFSFDGTSRSLSVSTTDTKPVSATDLEQQMLQELNA
jgi:gp32 DNA binding protein like